MTSKFVAILSLCAVIGTGASAQTLGAVNTDIGKVLVSAKTGMTLYTFRKDAKNTSNCYGDCATAWPPVCGACLGSATRCAQNHHP